MNNQDRINRIDEVLAQCEDILHGRAGEEVTGARKLLSQLSTNDGSASVSGSLLSDTDYWKQRCLLAEKCLEESHCDPDITSDQIKAWNAYHKFISWAGNNR